ncbi:MAG: threonine transporter [Flavobacterium psychrophilum]|nr:MAG: threonine transporter [Flavobacterium psychrophilum]
MLVILASGFPERYDLDRLVFYDYMIVHSADIDKGVSSLHAAVPNRQGELFVRRTLLQEGLDLYCSRGLIQTVFQKYGIEYCATEYALPFIEGLSEVYTTALLERSTWLIDNFGHMNSSELQRIVNSSIELGKNEFNLEII